jgi:hypothetical protein
MTHSDHRGLGFSALQNGHFASIPLAAISWFDQLHCKPL